MTNLEPILERLAHARSRLLRTADSVPADQWRTRPGSRRWSAGELVAHLIMIERGVLGSADRVIQDSPKRFPLFKRFHLPLVLVEARLIRTKSPLDVDPELVGEKETMMAELRNVRERILAFLDETKERDLSRYRWKHPFLGTMNTYDWLQMIACHEIRHEKQMRKIASAYRKS